MTRRAQLLQAKTLVIKVGSGVLVREGTRFDRGTFCRLVEEIARLVETGHQVALVSSGAVALGRGRMGGERPNRQRSLPKMQALAAVGQTALMQLYDSEFEHYALRCGQMLLTRDDLDNRGRYLNARRTLRTLWDLGVVPIINENDTVATDEIQFGDNDQLGARVACLIEADLFAILSDVDAFYTADPNSDPDARALDVLEAEDPALYDYISDGSKLVSDVGTGGMRTKLEGARIAARRGIPTIIVGGKRPDALRRALAGETEGTLLLPAQTKQKSRKAWIESLRVRGRIRCDEGARRALLEHGKSLLPSGIVAVDGRFLEGEAVELCGADGVPFGRGLASYAASAVERIAGKQSAEIESILGFYVADVIVHRDDLVLIGSRTTGGARGAAGESD